MYRIYCITNIINNKKYIGLTKFSIEERWKHHIVTALHRKKKYYIHHAILKYGSENFKIELLEENATKDREIYWIKLLNTQSEGYNLTAGGDGTLNRIVSVEERANTSQRSKLLHATKSIGMYGKKHSIETIDKMKKSAALINRSGIYNPMFGKKQTEETKRKISNRIITEEVRNNYSEAQKKRAKTNPYIADKNGMYGKKHSTETIDKLSKLAKNRKKVICQFCNKEMSPGNYIRWHGDKCKLNLI